ncbi:MAG: redoxin domain-containing protein [Rhodospirillales bacterium]|nr:redoxin domain-containing protein [Rhodospirillales bacterium]
MPTRRSLLTLSASGALAAGLLPVLRARAAAEAAAFTGLDGWINTDAPLQLEALRGKVVLVDFWTYSCINCRRTVPYLNRWQAQYGAAGLQVIGIHTPEFGFEHMRPNVAAAVRALSIRYPVGQDNDFRTWRDWGIEAWPSFVLLDRNGRIVLRREGEGHAHELETAIRALLGLSPSVKPTPGDDPDLSGVRTGEIYFGALHPTPQDRAQRPRLGEGSYTFPAAPPRAGEYQLDGTWLREQEALVLRSAGGGLRLRFTAAKLHLVAGATPPTRLSVRVDGGAPREVEIGLPTLTTLVDGSDYATHEVTVSAAAPGLSVFSATFG